MKTSSALLACAMELPPIDPDRSTRKMNSCAPGGAGSLKLGTRETSAVRTPV